MKTEIRIFLDLCDSCFPVDRDRGWNHTNRTRFSFLSSHFLSENPHIIIHSPLLLASLDHKQFELNRAVLIEIVLNYVGFEVLTVGVMKRSWDMTPCSRLKVGRSLGRTRRIHLQGQVAICFMLISSWFIIQPWRWRWHIPPECRFIFNIGEDVISHKTEFFDLN
jgi:hypothetical protein